MCEPFKFCVVIAQLKRTIHQTAHIDVLANHLTRRRRFSFTNKVATAKLFRRSTNGASDVVHVTLERKNTLRRAEAPERPMRRHARSDCAAVNPDVGT